MSSLKCISLKIQDCKVRDVIIDNRYMTYPCSFKVNKCHGNCNNIANPYSKVCVPDKIKNTTVKVFDLISQRNKTRQINVHERCKFVCRLDRIICNQRQRWKKNADVSV